MFPHMQYQGTWRTLMNNCGFSEYESKTIEKNFNNLHKVSVKWTQNKIQLASEQGYTTGAFGLRLRAPVLAQCIIGNEKTPREAAAEARTLGNMVSGQSYCLLNGRASEEFMRRVRASEYRHDIHLACHIHDAIYLYIRDDLRIIHWVNKHLLECMAWQDLPELQHPDIKIGSELSIAYPSWADHFDLKPGMTVDEIRDVATTEGIERKKERAAYA